MRVGVDGKCRVIKASITGGCMRVVWDENARGIMILESRKDVAVANSRQLLM